MFYSPLGMQTVCDARYLNDMVFTKEVLEELERRGYDTTTIKFSIEPQKGNERFASQRKQNETT
jgi:hypothetical protein